MTDQGWLAVKHALDCALQASPEHRAAVLDQLCPDPAIRREVERLLRARERVAAATTFLDCPAVEFAAPVMAEVIEHERNQPAALQAALAGRYTITRPLGTGGMATVYLVRDERHARLVALKVVHGSLAQADTPLAGAQRFRQEIEIAARLSHPHILPLHDSGAEAGLLYYTMPYVDGETLRERLERTGRQPIDVTLRILLDITRALAYAHRHGVVHCDIKPANILLNQDGDALLADFGVARALAAVNVTSGIDDAAAGTSDFVLGTPAYMAPEQLTGGQTSDHRADLYSLGVVAHEMLTGSLPFASNDAQDTESTLILRPDALPAVAALVTRLLARRPEERPQDATEVLQVLEAAIKDAQMAPAVARDAGASASRGHASAIRRTAAAVIVFGTAALASDYGGGALPGAASIAILAFANQTGSAASEHVANGLTDAVTAALINAKSVKVAPHTSALALQRSGHDLRAIADSLAVATVLHGSVRRADERLEITAQLTSAHDQRLLWSQSYAREMRELPAVQDEIASAVASALNLRLPNRPSPRSPGRASRDPEAYDLYLRARHSWKLRTQEGLERAVAYYEQAVERDPGFAVAFAGLAEAYINLSNYGHRPAAEALARARVAAERALAIDPRLAEAHAAQGYLHASRGEYARAEQALQRAVALNPNYSWHHHYYTLLLMMLGRTSEALQHNARALALDPLSLPANATRGIILYQAGNSKAAQREFERALALSPTLVLTLHYLGALRAAEGDYRGALELLQRAAQLAPDFTGVPGALAYVYQQTGQQRAADSLLAALKAQSAAGRAQTNLALAYAALGRADDAFPMLERVRWDVPTLIELRADPLLEPLRSDARYARLIRRIGADVGVR